jgi:hypothetical protein
VRKLTRHDNTDVVKEAKKIYHKWKHFFTERSKLKRIEVKYDAKTESLRAKARKHLATALGVQVNKTIVFQIDEWNGLPFIIHRLSFYFKWYITCCGGSRIWGKSEFQRCFPSSKIPPLPHSTDTKIDLSRDQWLCGCAQSNRP